MDLASADLAVVDELSTDVALGSGDLSVSGWTDLHQAILELEAAAAVPARGRGWVQRMGHALQRLADDLSAHAAAEDGPAGLYRTVMSDAPRHGGEIRRLRSEIDDMAGLVAWLLAVVAAGPVTQGVDWRLDIREDVTVLLGRLVRHRQSDHDLIYEAYTVDVGDAADA